ncbi:MAG: hypothetical protein J0H82_30500 [Alphaproteobacteria bacterium]|nr:hypothetical protein [Alphaproteobacteria bacterium]
MRIYLDLDGALADFEAGATNLLGVPPRQFEQENGAGVFWRRLAEADGFYRQLPLLPDAHPLFDAVQHLQPTILTGLPKAADRWVAAGGRFVRHQDAGSTIKALADMGVLGSAAA